MGCLVARVRLSSKFPFFFFFFLSIRLRSLDELRIRV
jgi:hypothetical protein